ncbi:hypothetical protein L3X38_040058 [Prunus dulcis]|uniref:Retrotransposon gag domain-containing protein n=1 Tax=Prunus dulcis TaxID=3755 RepID=A0AAD4YT24_PRUDU|nr:hypothetical protein L3X38_040058 [Prunus dulcis]
MADFAKISQKPSESVQEYLGRFREARARCTVNMSEHEFAKLAQGGLLLDLRKKFEGIEFRDIYDLLLRVDRYEALLNEEQQKGRPTPQPTFYRDSTKPSRSRTIAVHANAVQDLIYQKILKFLEKATMGVNHNPFPNAQVNMVNANFPRPDQPRPRLDLGGSAKAAAEKKARDIPANPKAMSKAKMYPEVAKVLKTKVSTKEEPPKVVVLCSRCQCEVILEVVLLKPKEPTKEPTKRLIKEQTKDQV